VASRRPLGGALRFVDHGLGLHWFPFWTFSNFDGGLHSILNAGRGQSRRLRGPEVPDQFAVAALGGPADQGAAR
jgi:hypothetical protein